MTMTQGTLLLLLMQTLIGWAVSHNEHDVRLVNHDGMLMACSGRVEIFHNGQWGTVCDDYWDLSDAQVVCRQMGCGNAIRALRWAHFGEGSGPIAMDDLHCTGNELALAHCQHLGFGNHNCRHYEDAGVECEAPAPTVRVVGADGQCSGRVEMLNNGVWGTVCDDYWDMADAQVVCREVGCGEALQAPGWASYGQGNGTIFLDNVHCTGEETSLSQCPHNGVGSHNCRSYEDAAVRCEEPVRLVGGDSHCSGRVEILHNGEWGTVCDDSWTMEDAEVVCHQLGCGRAVQAHSRARFGPGTGQIWLDQLACNGSESSLTQCPHIGLGNHDCSHYEDASVTCKEIPNYSVRLVGSNKRCSGRVEIYNNYHWGSVCDDRWGLSEAQVVCRQLGCGRVVDAPQRATFGRSPGPIWLDDLHCGGNESALSECGHSGVGNHNCLHVEDASVICEEYYALTLSAEISCSRYLFEVGVPMNTLREARLNAFSGHLANPFCHYYRVSGNTLWYQAPRLSGVCGTILKTNATHVIYSNALFFNALDNSTVGLPDLIPFSCAYPLHANVSMDGAIVPQLYEGGLTGLGSIEAHMYFYHSRSFTYRYAPGELLHAVGTKAHMEITVPGNDWRLKVVLDECYVTASPDPADHPLYRLIRNGCSMSPDKVTVLQSGESSYSCRAEALIYSINGNEPVYVHCSVHMCDSSAEECVPTCNRRERRAVKAEATISTVVTGGPILFQN